MQGLRAVQGRAIPGWIVSVVLHLLLLVACAMGLQSCQRSVGEDGAGDFRDVGLVVKSSGLNSDSTSDTDNTAPPAPQQVSEPVSAADTPDNQAIDQLLSLPDSVGPQILGPGARTPTSPLADPSQLLPRSALTGGPPLSGLQKGETADAPPCTGPQTSTRPSPDRRSPR